MAEFHHKAFTWAFSLPFNSWKKILIIYLLSFAPRCRWILFFKYNSSQAHTVSHTNQLRSVSFWQEIRLFDQIIHVKGRIQPFFPPKGYTQDLRNILSIYYCWLCCVCLVCVAQFNQHCNTRFTAPACQDSLWPPGFHHLPVHPVETKTAQKSAREQEGRQEREGGNSIFIGQILSFVALLITLGTFQEI